MGSACSQPKSGEVNQPSASNSSGATTTNTANNNASTGPTKVPAGGPSTVAAPASPSAKDTNAIDRTLNNMAKQESRKAAAAEAAANNSATANGGDAKGNTQENPNGVTSDEQILIAALLSSSQCAAITPPIVKIVRETWAESMKRSDFAVAFYNDLLTKHRSATEAIFYGVDIVLQAGRLVKMIEGAINLLEEPKSLVPVIIRLGSRHVAYGTTSQHFLLVTDSLTDLIRETVGPAKITPEVIGYWRTVLGFFQEIMEAGYTTSAGKAVARKHHARIQRTLLKCWKSAVAGHDKQLKQAGGSAPLPSVSAVVEAAEATAKAIEQLNNNNPKNSSGGIISNVLQQPHQQPLIFGVPSTICQAMLASGMQQYIVTGGNTQQHRNITSSKSNNPTVSTVTTTKTTQQQQHATADNNTADDHLLNPKHIVSESEVINVATSPIAGITTPRGSDEGNNVNKATAAGTTGGGGVPMNYVTAPVNHLLVPPISITALESFARLPPNEFDALISDAFEVGLSHIEEDMPYFSNPNSKLPNTPRPAEGVPPPPTVAVSEMLFNRLQMTGRMLSSAQLGAMRGDPESFSDAFVKSTLQFASPEWNNPFVRDQLARFWMKFCSYLGVSSLLAPPKLERIS